jgi:DNA polymerase III psi subunit
MKHVHMLPPTGIPWYRANHEQRKHQWQQIDMYQSISSIVSTSEDASLQQMGTQWNPQRGAFN